MTTNTNRNENGSTKNRQEMEEAGDVAEDGDEDERDAQVSGKTDRTSKEDNGQNTGRHNRHQTKKTTLLNGDGNKQDRHQHTTPARKKHTDHSKITGKDKARTKGTRRTQRKPQAHKGNKQEH